MKKMSCICTNTGYRKWCEWLRSCCATNSGLMHVASWFYNLNLAKCYLYSSPGMNKNTWDSVVHVGACERSQIRDGRTETEYADKLHGKVPYLEQLAWHLTQPRTGIPEKLLSTNLNTSSLFPTPAEHKQLYNNTNSERILRKLLTNV